MYGGVATPLAFLQQMPDRSKLLRVGQRSLQSQPQVEAVEPHHVNHNQPPPVPARNNSR